MVLPVAGGRSGQDAEVPAGTSMFPWGSFAVGRLPPTRWVGWDSSSSQSHVGKIHQSPSAGDLTLVSLLCGLSQSAVASGCVEAILREAHERGQGSGFAVGNFPWAGEGKHGLVPGAGTNVSVPWKGQAGEENLCLGSDERPLPSASNLICADCM